MFPDECKLDNPAWHSLSETHRHCAVDLGSIKFYLPDHSPFGGTVDPANVGAGIASYALLTDNFFVIGERPGFPPSLKLQQELVCEQMILPSRIELAVTNDIVKLADEHAAKLLDLVNLVQPGYFRSGTRLLGNYYGIFKSNVLIAVTGERMKMNRFTEVSAVVTHPEHTGRGYAKELIIHTTAAIFNEGKIPYLHVAETNAAIGLYEKLGFIKRRKISFWNITK